MRMTALRSIVVQAGVWSRMRGRQMQCHIKIEAKSHSNKIVQSFRCQN